MADNPLDFSKILSPAELKELELRKIPSIPIDVENFALRLTIAQKIDDLSFQAGLDHTKVDELRKKYPAYKFYKIGKRFVRLINFVICNCKQEACSSPEILVDVVEASLDKRHPDSLLLPNCPLSILSKPLDEWSKKDKLLLIKKCADADAFLDPCGFSWLGSAYGLED